MPTSLFADRFNHLLGTRLSPRGRPYHLVEIARSTGLPTAYLSELRRGLIAMPTLERALRLADFFGVDVRYFLDERGDSTREYLNNTPNRRRGRLRPEGPEGKWYPLIVRLGTEQYEPLAAACQQWRISPNALLRELVAAITPEVEAVAATLPIPHGATRAARAVAVSEALLETLALTYTSRGRNDQEIV